MKLLTSWRVSSPRWVPWPSHRLTEEPAHERWPQVLAQGAAMALRIRFARPASGHHLRSRILLFLLAAFALRRARRLFCLLLFLLQVPAHCGRAAEAADLRQHRQDLRRAARSTCRVKSSPFTGSPTSCARLVTPAMAPATFAVGHLQRRRTADHRAARPAVVSRAR